MPFIYFVEIWCVLYINIDHDKMIFYDFTFKFPFFFCHFRFKCLFPTKKTHFFLLYCIIFLDDLKSKWLVISTYLGDLI